MQNRVLASAKRQNYFCIGFADAKGNIGINQTDANTCTRR
jgi:hypothetical protein